MKKYRLLSHFLLFYFLHYIAIYAQQGLILQPENNITSNIITGRYSTPALADIDNDGDFDLFIGEESGKINFYRNAGTSTNPIFSLESNNLVIGGDTTHSAPYIVDIDNDADFDLFVGYRTIYFYRNIGTSTTPNFTLETIDFASISVGYNIVPTFVDIDSDGDFDLFIGNENGTINFYRNIGTMTNPNFGLESEEFSLIKYESKIIPTLADIDNDGDFDLFVAADDTTIEFYRNANPPSNLEFKLQPGVLSTLGIISNSSPVFADIDSDGDLDLFLGEANGGLRFYRITTLPYVQKISEILTFVDTKIGRPIAGFYWYENFGFSVLKVDTIISNNRAFYVSPTSFNVEPDGYTVGIFDIYFDPIKLGLNEGILIVKSNYPVDTLKIYVKGTGLEPDLEIETDTLSFGSVHVSKNRKQVLRLFNNTSSNLKIDSTRSDNPTFSASFDSSSIRPDTSINLSVNFSPIKVGEQNGILTISYRANFQSSFYDRGRRKVQLLGNGFNHQPRVINKIPDIILALGGDSFERDLNTVFSDLDGDELTYSVSCSDTNIAKVVLSGSKLNVIPIAAGYVIISIAASDVIGELAQMEFGITVILTNKPPIITHTPFFSPVQEGQNITIAVNIIDDSGIAVATLYYRKGGEIKFSETPILAVGELFEGIIPSNNVTSRGLEYYVTVQDIDGLITREPAQGFYFIQVKILNPGILSVTPLPGGTEQTAYRLFSIPIDLNNKNPGAVLEDDLGRYNIKKWRFYDLLPEQTYDEYPVLSGMVSGKSFWLIVKETNKVIDSGAGISNSTSDEYAIALHPKWNFIGNPFNFDIPIENIHLKSGKAFSLRSFSGSWNNPITEPISSLIPFEGYAIFNDSSAMDTFLINPDLSVTPSSLTKNNQIMDEKDILWSIRVLAQCQEAFDNDNILGMASKSSTCWDNLDLIEPPVIGEYVSVYFPHPEWKKLNDRFCTDFRPESSNGYIWEFEVRTNINDKVNLSFEGLDTIPTEFEILLIDDELNILQSLGDLKTFSIAGLGEDHPKRLRIAVGIKDFIEDNIDNLNMIPETYELSQNFPNPFNSVTTIRYGLIKEQKVTLKIYNVIGKEIVTLVNNEKKPAGYHVVIWDGRDRNGNKVPSGIYVYKIFIEALSLAKKMLVIK